VNPEVPMMSNFPVDYSALELRILAQMQAQERAATRRAVRCPVVELALLGLAVPPPSVTGDIYAETAAMMFNRPHTVTGRFRDQKDYKAMRQAAQTAMFARLYGGGFISPSPP